MKRIPKRPPSMAWALAAGCMMTAVPRLEAAAILEETFQVTSGWNLIRVSVEPLVKDPRLALDSIDWESLWTWVPSASGPGGRWVGLRRGEPAFLSGLNVLAGPACYALLARAGGVLKLKGALRGERPALRAGYQLFGPSVPAIGPPTLASYFSRPGVKDHLRAVYEIAGGSYRRVAEVDSLRRGAAYWVLVDQDLPAPEPLRLKAGFGGMRFNSHTTLAEIEIDVGAASEARQITVKTIPPADGTSTADWLQRRGDGGEFEPVGGGGGEGGGGAVIVLPPEETVLRLEFRALRPSLAQAGKTEQAVALEIAAPTGSVLVGAELSVPTLKGFWIGEARLSEVKSSSALGGAYAAAPSLQFSLILEVPEAGAPRLLPCVQIETDRDGRRLLHRIEAALFHSPQTLSGTLGSDGKGGVLAGSQLLDPDHPLNPYRHRYHPEHQRSYPLSRALRLDFDALPGAGPEEQLGTVGTLGGTYEETILGLTLEPVEVRGSFRLRRLTDDTVTACSAGGL